MFHVDDQVAGGQCGQLGEEGVGALATPLSADQAVAEHVLFGEDRHLGRVEAMVEGQDDEGCVGPGAQCGLPALGQLQALEAMILKQSGKALASAPYYVMGQICIAKPFRGQGVFDALYQGHKAHYQSRFELLITEVSVNNARSLRAHERVGFEPIHRYRDDVDEWLIIGWDWS